MIQISEPEESESLNKNIPAIHYRFNRKFNFYNCHSQLYISDSQLKIIINCAKEYSKDIKTYSNSFSLQDLQNISKYYTFFNKIEDILEDIANIFNQGNYNIEQSEHKLNIILQLVINEEIMNIKLPLNLIKNIKDKENKKKKVLNNNKKKIEEFNPYQNNRRINHNVGIKSVNDLNSILTDIKDRLTVLEVTQNTSNNIAKNTYNKSYGGNINDNNNILLTIDSILKRIDKLEEENNKKTERINYLKEKIKAYEPEITATSDNESVNDVNTFNSNNMNPNQKYINLGTIKNVDTSTITSNNSINIHLDNKEDELNNSFNEKKKKRKIQSSNSYQYNNNKDNNINNQKNKIKSNIKKNKNKSQDKLNKNKEDYNDENQYQQINQNNNYINQNPNININNENNINQFSKKLSGIKINNESNNINNDIKNIKMAHNKSQPNLNHIISYNQNNFDSQKMINNLEKNFLKKSETQDINKSLVKTKKTKQFENNNKMLLNNNNDNYYNNNLNNINNSINKDNNNDNYYNNKLNNINNSINKDNNYNNNNIKNNINNNNNMNSSNSNYENNEKINTNNNQMIQRNSSSNPDSSGEQEEKMKEKMKEKNKELELERELEEKEERKRRQKTFKETSSGNDSLKVKQIKKSLTMAPKEDIRLYCKSHIIFTKDELRLLKKKINTDKNRYSVFFDVLYRASEDGDDVDYVKKIMAKEKKTLTLFETEKGARFGIYVEKKLDTTILMTQYLAERPGTCFLVSLNNLEIYDIYKKYVSNEHKLCFIKNSKKNKNGSAYAIYTPPKKFLGQACYLGDLNSYFNVENEDIIGEKEEYKLKDVEICKVSIEVKGEQEEIKNLYFRKTKTEIPKNINIKEKNDKNKEKKFTFGREYSFQNQENSSEENINEIDNNNKIKYNKKDEEKISNKFNYDYYDSGIIKGKYQK